MNLASPLRLWQLITINIFFFLDILEFVTINSVCSNNLGINFKVFTLEWQNSSILYPLSFSFRKIIIIVPIHKTNINIAMDVFTIHLVLKFLPRFALLYLFHNLKLKLIVSWLSWTSRNNVFFLISHLKIAIYQRHKGI